MNFVKLGLTGLVVSLGLFAGNAMAGQFVESDTEAVLRANGEDDVLSVVRVGFEDHNNTSYYSAALGGGYTAVADEAVVSLSLTYSALLAEKTMMEAEVDALYGLRSDDITVTPKLLIRQYF